MILTTNKMLRYISVFLLFFLIQCTGYTTYAPLPGVTEKFFYGSPQKLRDNPTFKFSKLQKDYGLVIFTYWLDGFQGDNDVNSVKKQGIRVWQYKFNKYDPDSIVVTEKIKLFSFKEIGTKNINLDPVVITDEKDVILADFTYKRNAIVYGGKIVASDYKDRFIIIDRFDDDCGNFLHKYATELENVNIETILIKGISG